MLKTSKLFIVLAFFLLCFLVDGFSVVSIDRNVFFAPLKSSSTTNDIDFFTFTAAWAEFGKYLPEPYTDFNHFWIAKAGVSGELFRYKNTFSVLLYSDIELIASSNNIIYFDPRAFYWQEGILVSYKYNNFNFQGSFTHRCKHDVDNADLVTLYREVRARVIIWDSVMFRFFLDPIELFEYMGVKLNVLPFFRNDFYILSVDEMVWYRISFGPSYIGTETLINDSYYRVNKVVDSMSFGYILDLSIAENFGFYSKGYLWFDFLADKPIWQWSRIEEVIKEHYLEFGFYVKGNGIRLMLFIQNNLLREPAIEPFDQGNVNFFHIGLKAVNEKFMF